MGNNIVWPAVAYSLGRILRTRPKIPTQGHLRSTPPSLPKSHIAHIAHLRFERGEVYKPNSKYWNIKETGTSEDMRWISDKGSYYRNT